MSLSKLPYEIISLIVQELDLDDVFHLSLSPRFSYLIQEDRVCKAILEVLFAQRAHTLQFQVLLMDTRLWAWTCHPEKTKHDMVGINLS